MDITELLKKEHEEVSALFQKFFGGGTITRLMNKVSGNKPPRRRSIAAKICDDLTMHATLEEQVFYPAVQETGDEQLNKLVQESLREHNGVKEKIAKAQSQLDDDEALEETMSAIQGDVDHHVREEENEMFPQVHNVMSDKRLGELGREYAAGKREMKGRATATTRTGAKSTRASTGGRQTSGGRASRGRSQSSRGRKRSTGGRQSTGRRQKSSGSSQRGRRTATSAAQRRKASNRRKSASAGRQRRRTTAKRARGARR